MSDIGDFISQVGSGVGDLYQGEGAAAQAKDFTGAATLATQNAQLAAASTRIQETQTARAVSQTLGTQQTDVAGAGFTESGSALDLLKSSASQGALAKSLVNIQGAINENSYAAQAGAYQGEAAAAKESAKASTVGAIASIGGAIIGGVGALASAGKTVVQGYNYLFGDSSVGGTADQIISGEAANASQFTESATDLSLRQGSNFGDLISSEAASTETLDTSEIALGTSEDAVDAGLTDVTGDLSADFLAEDVGADAADFLAEDAASAAAEDAAAEVAGDVVADAAGDSILDGLGDLAAAAASVICTAFYHRKMIPREIWIGAQRYGQSMPSDVFAGYNIWAFPVAQKIKASPEFAKFAAKIFMPAIYEMGVELGYNQPRFSTLRGRVTIKLCYALSWIIGKIPRPKGGYHVTARA